MDGPGEAHDARPPQSAAAERAAAIAIWNRMVDESLGRGLGFGLFRLGDVRMYEPFDRRRRPVPLWPYSQVMHARVLLRAATGWTPETTGPLQQGAGEDRRAADAREVSAVPPLLAEYAAGPAFAARPGGSGRFIDDNAWVALAQLQHRFLLDRASPASAGAVAHLEWIGRFVDPDGGVRWVEGGPSRHACAAGVGVALALAAPVGMPSPALDVAARVAHFLREVLADDRGLVRDNIDAEGRIDPTIWVYNQALPVRIELALHRAGVSEAFGRATTALEAGLAHFDDDRLAAQPLAFDAIWCRSLAAYEAASRISGRELDADIARAARLGLTARVVAAFDANGWRVPGVGGPLGRYENGESDVLDTAAAIQILALSALEDHQLAATV